MAAMTSQEP